MEIISSSGSIAADSPASRGLPKSVQLEAPDRVQTRKERTSGKGRRRRAAAEERRIEQQTWGRGVDDGEDFEVAPPHVNRRRSCRSSRRRNPAQEALDDYQNEYLDHVFSETASSLSEESTLDIALALALSLSDLSSADQHSARELSAVGMSYENLVLLEDVKVTAQPMLVNALQEIQFEETENPSLSRDSSGVCVICQCEYVMSERLMVLPCSHKFHHACGAEWLLNYSKLCPVCKHDITL